MKKYGMLISIIICVVPCLVQAMSMPTLSCRMLSTAARVKPSFAKAAAKVGEYYRRKAWEEEKMALDMLSRHASWQRGANLQFEQIPSSRKFNKLETSMKQYLNTTSHDMDFILPYQNRSYGQPHERLIEKPFVKRDKVLYKSIQNMTNQCDGDVNSIYYRTFDEYSKTVGSAMSLGSVIYFRKNLRNRFYLLHELAHILHADSFRFLFFPSKFINSLQSDYAYKLWHQAKEQRCDVFAATQHVVIAKEAASSFSLENFTKENEHLDGDTLLYSYYEDPADLHPSWNVRNEYLNQIYKDMQRGNITQDEIINKGAL